MAPTSAHPPSTFPWLVQVVDAALAGCVFLVPLLMGGRHPWGQWLLVLLAAAAALAWAIHQMLQRRPAWRPTAALPLVVAALLLPAIQIAPLPPPVLERIAPHTLDLLPLWTPAGDPAARLGLWNTISLAPAETLSGLVLLAAYGLLFLVAVQRIQSPGDLERILRWCAAAAVVMAGFGLVQFFTSNGAFYWFYEHPFSTTSDAVKGSFTNRNHFAQFLALGIGPLLWSLHAAHRQTHGETTATRTAGTTRKPSPQHSPQARGGDTWCFRSDGLVANLHLMALAVVVFAAMLSLSRGGMLALGLAAVVAASVLWVESAARRRLALALAGAALLVGLALTIFGYDRVSRRVEDLSSGSIERLDSAVGRRAVWGAVLQAVPRHLALGWGIGSHREVYPLYFDLPSNGKEFTHAENCYLQILLEAGLPGLALATVGIAACAFWCVAGLRRSHSRRLSACLGAIAASLAASAAHALVDFVWYVPACAAIAVILAACAQRACQLAGRGPARRTSSPGHPVRCPDRRVVPVPRPAMAAIALVLGLAALAMVRQRTGPASAEASWRRFLALEAARNARPEGTTPEPSADGKPAPDADAEAHRERIACLERVAHSHPSHARARLELARAYLGLFDLRQASASNPISLANVRDAALASRFRSREALDEWLARAVGRHRVYLDRALEQTRSALQLCPLQGEGYLFLAKLCFLTGAPDTAKTAYLSQALRVRPFDGGVLFECATEAWLAGEPDLWIDYLRRACRSGRRHQRHVLRQLLANTPPEALAEMLDLVICQLEPDLEGLDLVHALASRRGRPDQLVRLRRHYAERAETEARAAAGPSGARLWIEAHRLHRDLGNTTQALECARSAQACDPGDYHARYGQALCLVELGRLEEADRQLQWCLQRKPDNAPLRELAKQVLRKRLESSGRAQAMETEVLR